VKRRVVSEGQIKDIVERYRNNARGNPTDSGHGKEGLLSLTTVARSVSDK